MRADNSNSKKMKRKDTKSICTSSRSSFADEAEITLIKIWLEVGQEEQERRSDARINDPLRQGKLSPMDVGSYRRMPIPRPGLDAQSDGYKTSAVAHRAHRRRRRGRLNCISHILARIPFKKIAKDKVKLPKRSTSDKYDDQASLKGKGSYANVVEDAGSLSALDHRMDGALPRTF
jgi:hypothetical protein